MELLRMIARQPLPYTIYAPADIDKLRVLRAAGLVSAFVPPTGELPGGGGSHRPAQVLAITRQGHQALQDRAETASTPGDTDR